MQQLSYDFKCITPSSLLLSFSSLIPFYLSPLPFFSIYLFRLGVLNWVGKVQTTVIIS